ncbi:TIGR03088 family PEP-CTERM/XrtA system glycosyltransferase [Massilia dura]|uniref:TIGR03088 family PEP-CTERM/XrtA system glycosyltransferase n=1 Tax=Pseudoduganella dura TaxID=321982 RepID=A0A6I3XFJ3_9BURK|nr:TIGR03088 family PEP-CTERM/XrtA system glycosyltransferase [Pseudoduganella dura]MUI13280.1 TIGR03088 family PEP-CTERM/XrtA system glycosyltransferase [Pseudoduganella dura]GGX90402.1 glycosyl transferase [Pseudoduganella dura]
MNDIPLIVHLIYRLDFGGLETLMVERINRMPAGAYRHAIVCLTDYNPAFARKITRADVEVHALHKQPGQSPGTHAALWRLLRRLRPAVLHSYNLSAVEYGPAALLAGVPVRVNGAHGRDHGDPHGTNRKHNALRRLMVPFYDCCYANSAAMETWNRDVIRVPAHKSRMLANGIDAERFQPRVPGAAALPEGCPFGPGDFVIGTVGRVQAVKDHATLVDAFALLRTRRPDVALRLAIVGDGPLLDSLRSKVASLGLENVAWLPGARTDVAQILHSLHVFAMPSIAEGTPGSALEAMASGLPVVGTRVGGIPEVVDEGVTGTLVPASDPVALAAALETYVLAPELAARHGAAGRERVLRKYSMAAMVAAYHGMYDSLCERKIKTRGAVTSCAE